MPAASRAGSRSGSQRSAAGLGASALESVLGREKGLRRRILPGGALARPWLVVLVVSLLYLGVVLARNGGDPLVFATVGSRYGEGEPAGSEGYDGQFAYFIALDPVGASQRLDAPSYRYQRILYPMLARWLALGRPDILPWTLVSLNVVALAAGTALMERLLLHYGVGRWYALTYGLYAGQLMSARLDLNEPLSYSLVIAAIWAMEQERPVWSALLFALAALTKETALVFAGAYGAYLFLAAGWRPALRFGAVAVGPYACWQLFLWRWLGVPGLGSGGAMATSFEFVPFMGLWRIGAVSWSALLLYSVILGPLVVLPTLWALWRTGRELAGRRWHPVSLALFANGAVLLFLPHSTWREFLAMLRLSGGLVAAVLLYAALRRDYRVLNYSFGWLAALAFVVKEGPVV